MPVNPFAKNDAEVRSQLRAVIEYINTAEAQVGLASGKVQSHIDNAQTDAETVATTAQQVATTEAEIMQRAENVQNAETEISEALATVSGLETDLVNLAGAVTTAQGDVSTAQADLATLLQATTALTQQLAEIQTQIDALSVPQGPADHTPDAISFTDITDAATTATVTSNTVTVTGIDDGAPYLIAGGVAIVDGVPAGDSGTINSGQTIALRVTTSGLASTASIVSWAIGTTSGDWTVTTAAPAVQTVIPFGDSQFAAHGGHPIDNAITAITAGDVNNEFAVVDNAGQKELRLAQNGATVGAQTLTFDDGSTLDIEVLANTFVVSPEPDLSTDRELQFQTVRSLIPLTGGYDVLLRPGDYKICRWVTRRFTDYVTVKPSDMANKPRIEKTLLRGIDYMSWEDLHWRKFQPAAGRSGSPVIDYMFDIVNDSSDSNVCNNIRIVRPYAESNEYTDPYVLGDLSTYRNWRHAFFRLSNSGASTLQSQNIELIDAVTRNVAAAFIFVGVDGGRVTGGNFDHSYSDHASLVAAENFIVDGNYFGTLDATTSDDIDGNGVANTSLDGPHSGALSYNGDPNQVGARAYTGLEIINNNFGLGGSRGENGAFNSRFDDLSHTLVNSKFNNNRILCDTFNAGTFQGWVNNEIMNNTFVMIDDPDADVPQVVFSEGASGNIVENNLLPNVAGEDAANQNYANNVTLGSDPANHTPANYLNYLSGPVFDRTVDTEAELIAAFTQKPGGPLDVTPTIGAIAA